MFFAGLQWSLLNKRTPAEQMAGGTDGRWDRWQVGQMAGGTDGRWDRWQVGQMAGGTDGRWDRWQVGQMAGGVPSTQLSNSS